MSDLLQKLKLGTDHTKLIDFPGTTQKVVIRILSTADLQMATFNTERLFKAEKIDINIVSANDYDDERATQMLYMALRDPENQDEPIARTITEFRRSITKEIKSALVDEYLTFEKDVSPTPDNLSSEELDRTIAEVKKKPETILTSAISTAMLKKLIIILASPPTNLQTGNG
jgi:hypothetical protein